VNLKLCVGVTARKRLASGCGVLTQLARPPQSRHVEGAG
jgi:hypothetical protein